MFCVMMVVEALLSGVGSIFLFVMKRRLVASMDKFSVGASYKMSSSGWFRAM